MYQLNIYHGIYYLIIIVFIIWVWSLGVCIYYLLTGEFPFENEEKLEDDSKMPDINLTIAKNHSNVLTMVFL